MGFVVAAIVVESEKQVQSMYNSAQDFMKSWKLNCMSQ